MTTRPALVALILTFLAAIASPAASLTPISRPHETAMIYATTVSSDGAYLTYAAGEPSGWNVYRWHNGEDTLIPRAYGTIPFSPIAISTDGLTIIGNDFDSSANPYIYRWTSAGGTERLSLPESIETEASGLSHDGNTIVGYYTPADNPQALRWTSTGGMQTLDSGGASAKALAVSADGSTTVGFAGNAAVRWTEDGAMHTLSLPGTAYSTAQSISADGSTIIGTSDLGSFLWTEEDGMLITDNNNLFTLTSSDGRLLAGASDAIWDKHHGLRSLYDILPDLGIDISNWTFDRINGIGYDDHHYYLAGTGTFYEDTIGFLVTLDSSVNSIPEPSTWALLGLAAILLLWRLKRIA